MLRDGATCIAGKNASPSATRGTKAAGSVSMAEPITRRTPRRAASPASHVTDDDSAYARKQRVLTHGTPSITASIADAVVIKDDSLFFLCDHDGRVPFDTQHGLGLYYEDCRFVNGYDVEVAGVTPRSLVAAAPEGYRAVIALTTPDLELPDGRTIHKESIGIRWERLVDGRSRVMHDRIVFRSFALERVELPLVLRFRAKFEDVFLVRGMLDPSADHEPPSSQWRNGMLHFSRPGLDGRRRVAVMRFAIAPDDVRADEARFTVELPPRGHTSIALTISVAVLDDDDDSGVPAPRPDLDAVSARLRDETERWRTRHTRIRTDSLVMNRLVDRARRDLAMLRTWHGNEEYFAAGVPWFATLFGRDSAIAALQTLASDPAIAANTARVLARRQGNSFDPWRDEQPGKILHELRVGELARARIIPHSPYYGSVDATPLFLILIARYAAWTGDPSLFSELRDNVERALTWIDQHGDHERDGYVEYRSTSDDGLINQGWKDSGDAIVDGDGTLAEPPIALVEVQAYICDAKRSIASLYRLVGDSERASRLEAEAENLRGKLNRDFWLDDLGIYAMALTADKRPTRVVASNAGHVLWAGVADPIKARRTMERLLADDMNGGWGIRTLSCDEARYNPFGYHLGTVWPHDNVMIAAGFRRYGFDDAARRVVGDLFDAAMRFEELQVPELYGGFPRAEFGVPVRYPVANHPQAWGAGSVLYAIEALLGLEPDAFRQRLRIVRPMLPEHVDRLELQRLRVGDARVNLFFERRNGVVNVEVRAIDGTLRVDVGDPASLGG